MTEKLQNQLYKKFNRIFTQKGLSLRWGFECDDGWYELIYGLCEKIQAYIDGVKCQQVIATQVKEKFGSLRFYIAFDLLNEDDVIDEYDVFVVLPWHFKNFFINSEKFKNKKLLFPLPNPEVVSI